MEPHVLGPARRDERQGVSSASRRDIAKSNQLKTWSVHESREAPHQPRSTSLTRNLPCQLQGISLPVTPGRDKDEQRVDWTIIYDGLPIV